MRDPWLPPPQGFLENLEQFQSLLAPGITLVAAMIALGGVWWNVSTNKAIERTRRAQKLAALRAVLPITLSAVSGFARENFLSLIGLLDRCADKRLKHSDVDTFEIAELSPAVIEGLAQLIEHADKLDVQIIIEALQSIQIGQARLRSLARSLKSTGTTTRHYLESLSLQYAAIYARASVAFAYARGETRELPKALSWSDVESAMKTNNVLDVTHVHLYKHMHALIEGKTSASSI